MLTPMAATRINIIFDTAVIISCPKGVFITFTTRIKIQKMLNTNAIAVMVTSGPA
jgi:hypothetical protein